MGSPATSAAVSRTSRSANHGRIDKRLDSEVHSRGDTVGGVIGCPCGSDTVRRRGPARTSLEKLPFGSRPVCYCFGESEASIRAEVEANRRSLGVERIREHIPAGRCACEFEESERDVFALAM